MKERRDVENLYLIKDDSQLATFRDFVVKNTEKLKDYQSFLKNELAVCDLPQAVFGQVLMLLHRLLGKVLFQPIQIIDEWL